MSSEVRRAALALMARREERFTTHRQLADARERLDHALASMSFSRVDVRREWVDAPKGPELVVRLDPVPGVELRLRMLSLSMVVLLAASVWAIASKDVSRSIAFLLPMATGFLVLALPIVGAALGSQREGEEARLRKAIRTALADEAQ